MRFTVRAILAVIPLIAVLLGLERVLFAAAVRALKALFGPDNAHFADVVLLWSLLNVALVVVLGPILFAMKGTDSFDFTR
jgi:hypothetical protein